MKVIVHDLGKEYNEILQKKCDVMIHADGKYAPCQGCFGCWTKHPAECYMKDSLHTVCRVIGKADELTIISENCYNTEQYLITNDYRCSNCGRNFKSNERFLKKFARTYSLKSKCEQLYNDKKREIESMVFCCEKCRYEKEDEVEEEFKEFVRVNDPMGETWVNRDDFKEFENGFIYKITKKSTGEFYVGQTKYAPIFRWGEHLKTNRFPLQNIIDYKFETLEIVKKDKLFEREAYWINKCRNENPSLSLNIQIPKEKQPNLFDLLEE